MARRNANNLNHPDTVKGLKSLTPAFNWPRYFEKMNVAKFENVNIANPEFFKTLEVTLNNTSLEDLKTYLAWHITHANVSTCPRHSSPKTSIFQPYTYRNERAAAAMEALRGSGRWRSGEALGQKYVEVAFAGDSKERMLEDGERPGSG